MLRKVHYVAIVLSLVMFVAAQAEAVSVSVLLTTDDLNLTGFAGAKYNDHHVASPDVGGEIWMSTTTGEGNILKVQQSGDAGSGETGDPLLVTITAVSHQDVVVGLPTVPHDYYAGAIYLSKDEHTDSLRDEGLGVKALEVEIVDTGLDPPDDWTVERMLDTATGRVKLDGSKEVSGGTDDGTFDRDHPNGAPHVDEAVTFDFNHTVAPVSAEEMVVVLTKFKESDGELINLHIELVGGEIIDLDYIGTTSALFSQIPADGTDVWRVSFDEIPEIDLADVLKSFTIQAVDPADVDGTSPEGTAEHFLIHGFTTTASFAGEPVIPEPLTVVAVMMGLGGLGGYIRKRRLA